MLLGSQENLSRSFGSGSFSLSDSNDSLLDIATEEQDALSMTPPSPGFTPPFQLTPPTTKMGVSKSAKMKQQQFSQSLASTQSFSASESDDESVQYLSPFYSDEEEEQEEENSKVSLTRLMSIETRRSMEYSESDEEEEAIANPFPTKSTKSKKLSKTSSGSNVVIPPVAQLEPVGLFWDIENCPIPTDKSAFAFANKMRARFFKGKREAEFMCVCDTMKERRDVIDELQKAHVCPLDYYIHSYFYNYYR